MKFGPARVVVAVADALFETDDAERLRALGDDVLAYVSAAAFTTRMTLGAALWLLRWSPLLLLVSWRPFDRLTRERRRDALGRIERSPFGLALVPWRTLLMLHFFEDARELARIGYRDERKRHLAIIPVAATSGVRLRSDSSGDLEQVEQVEQVEQDEKGAA
jgi:hypothetical protein